MSTKNCPSCGAPIDLNATECKYCGESITATVQENIQQAQSTYQQPMQPGYQQPVQPGYQQPMQPGYQQPMQPGYQARPIKRKSKVAAGLLALFLGGFGAHKFYLNKVGMGVLYFLFSWTYIPALIAFVEAIIYFCTSEDDFNIKYVN